MLGIDHLSKRGEFAAKPYVLTTAGVGSRSNDEFKFLSICTHKEHAYR